MTHVYTVLYCYIHLLQSSFPIMHSRSLRISNIKWKDESWRVSFTVRVIRTEKLVNGGQTDKQTDVRTEQRGGQTCRGKMFLFL